MTTLLLATTGGHLRQLDQLAKRLRLDDTRWITNEDEQSRALLAGRSVDFIPYVGPRDVTGVLRCVKSAHRTFGERSVHTAVSTGSGVALGYLPYLAARGVSCHYIESATRVSGPSVTGRLLSTYPAIRVYTQYRHWAGRRWSYAGNIFDDYEVLAKASTRSDRFRVVVSVGIATGYSFRRLIDHLIPILRAGGRLEQRIGLPVEVTWQTAGTPTDDLPIETRETVPSDELGELFASADAVVCHAGTGSAVAALQQGRRPILAPRLPSVGEIQDDHQVQLAEELSSRGLAVARDASAISVDDLIAARDVRVRSRTDVPEFLLRR
ncbi:UDP-N-acetylglucosamine:LPS N-acetylglucosamine transferase [Pseudonocardia sediminis]|uniref:UDP-N-acetylglucosamine:LPS N-acetylglucosamine transferase n=1 Tax=Pseudonocardia sediminis TaxID=1397368 RepID=A0A4Q7V0R0_PSEST|nr:glycosyltransferase [Pseudonocardia sediminis]RZT87876.1 UDP-N-acetylglucosamine:LPS N-acetylglucosamine transferase [Pseudonocardia sediminis]